MNIEFVRELDANYLILEGQPEGNEFERKMLLYGRPSAFLPFRIYREGEDPAYSYEISGKQSLSAMTQTSQIDEKRMREILYSIHSSCEEAELYLLRSSGLCLDPGLIYKGKEGWRFVYHPDREEDLWEQLQKLSRFFLKKCNHEDERTAQIAYELLRVCHEENSSFSQIFELWDQPEPQPLINEETAVLPEKRKRNWFKLGKH